MEWQGNDPFEQKPATEQTQAADAAPASSPKPTNPSTTVLIAAAAICVAIVFAAFVMRPSPAPAPTMPVQVDIRRMPPPMPRTLVDDILDDIGNSRRRTYDYRPIDYPIEDTFGQPKKRFD